MLTNDNESQTATLDHCRFLRCKEMFIDTGRDFHTQNCVGPDGQTVALEDCRPGRTCHEAS